MPNPSGPNAYPSGPLAYPSAPNLWTASAALSSTSTLAASAVKVRPASAALSSTSTLSANGANQAVTSASLVSTSTLTATVFAVRLAAAALASSSTGPNADSTKLAIVAVALVSTSTLTATATVTPQSSATLFSASSLYALSSQSSDITLSSNSTLVAVPRLAGQAAITLSSTSTLTAAPRLTARTTAALAASSTLSASAGGTFGMAASLTSVSAVFFTTGTRVDVATGLTSTSSLSASPGQLAAVSYAMLSASSLVAIPGSAVSSPGGPGNLTPSDLIAVPQTKVPSQHLLVADTITGKIVFELPYTSLSWSSPLNKAGQASANVIVEAALEGIYAQGVAEPRDALREVLLGPYRFSLVVTYGNEALFAGPYLPSDDLSDNQTIAIGAAGLETILDKRILTGAVLNTGTGELSDPSRDLTYTTNPAGAIYQIASHAVATGGGAKPGRSLPLYCPAPPKLLGIEEFTYLSYDLVTAWKAISDIVGRDDGPDVRIEPFLAAGSDGYYVRWNLEIGNPGLAGRGALGPDGPLPWTWDDDTCRISRSIDAQGMGTTFISTGSGQDRAKLMATASTSRLSYLGFPILERPDTAANSETSTRKLAARVNAFASAHEAPTDSWKLKVPVDGDPALGQFRRGDIARIESRNHLLIERGTYLRRITEVSGDGSGWANITCDYEDGVS